MKKKFSSALSITLAGLLAVGGIGVSPMTAYAYAEEDDVISFSAGELGTGIVDAWKDGVTLDDTTATITNGKIDKDADLPASTIVKELSTEVPKGYHFAWYDGKNDLLPYGTTVGTASKFTDINVPKKTATLTARWAGNPITIKAENLTNNADDPDNPGQTHPSDVVANYGTKIYKTPLATLKDEPEWIGLSFKGWDLNNDPATIEIPKGADVNKYSDEIDKAYLAAITANPATTFITAHAVWDEPTYTITLDGNGASTGSFPVVSGTYAQLVNTYDTALNITATRTGYTPAAKEWALTKDGSGDVLFAKADKIDKVVREMDKEKVTKTTLYYNWKENNHKVTIKQVNNSAQTPAPIAFTVGKATGTTIWDASKSKYVSSTGWTASGSDQYVSIGDYTGAIILPTVTDIVTPTNNEIAFASGYEFKGYATTPTELANKVVKYKAGDEVKISTTTAADINLYPILEAVPVPDAEYTITYTDKKAQPETMPSKGNIVSGSKVKLDACTFTPEEGKHFAGWSTTDKASYGAGDVDYKDGQEITVTANLTLYSVYVADEFTIEYHEESNVKNLKYGVAAGTALENSTPSANSYTFLGWSENKDAKNPEYTRTTQAKELNAAANSTVVLYGIYAPTTETVTVKYDKGDGTTPASPVIVSVRKGEGFTISSSATHANYELYGWTERKHWLTKKLAEDAGADILVKGTSWSTDESTTLYPCFVPATATVKFDGNGATTGTMNDISVTYNETTGEYTIDKLPANTYERSGYSFIGWNQTQAATTAAKLDEAENVNTTVTNGTGIWYAVWKENTNKVVYNRNNSDSAGLLKYTQIVASTGGDVTAASNIEIPGVQNTLKYDDENKVFIGWALSESATTPDFAVEDLATITYKDVLEKANAANGATINVYAVWTDSDAIKAEKAEAEAEEAKKAQAEAEAAKEEADQKAADAETAKTAAEAAKATSDKKAADAETAKTAAEAAKAASDKKAADAATEAANQKKAADAAKAEAEKNQKALDAANAKVATSETIAKLAGKTKKVSGSSYKTDADGGKSVTVTKAKNAKTVTIGKTVKISKNTYKVRSIKAKAFTGKKIRTLKINGANLLFVDNSAFTGTKATKITVTNAKNVKAQLKAAAGAAGLKFKAKGNTVTITKK